MKWCVGTVLWVHVNMIPWKPKCLYSRNVVRYGNRLSQYRDRPSYKKKNTEMVPCLNGSNNVGKLHKLLKKNKSLSQLRQSKVIRERYQNTVKRWRTIYAYRGNISKYGTNHILSLRNLPRAKNSSDTFYFPFLSYVFIQIKCAYKVGLDSTWVKKMEMFLN